MGDRLLSHLVGAMRQRQPADIHGPNNRQRLNRLARIKAGTCGDMGTIKIGPRFLVTARQGALARICKYRVRQFMADDEGHRVIGTQLVQQAGRDRHIVQVAEGIAPPALLDDRQAGTQGARRNIHRPDMAGPLHLQSIAGLRHHMVDMGEDMLRQYLPIGPLHQLRHGNPLDRQDFIAGHERSASRSHVGKADDPGQVGQARLFPRHIGTPGVQNEARSHRRHRAILQRSPANPPVDLRHPEQIGLRSLAMIRPR